MHLKPHGKIIFPNITRYTLVSTQEWNTKQNISELKCTVTSGCGVKPLPSSSWESTCSASLSANVLCRLCRDGVMLVSTKEDSTSSMESPFMPPWFAWQHSKHTTMFLDSSTISHSRECNVYKLPRSCVDCKIPRQCLSHMTSGPQVLTRNCKTAKNSSFYTSNYFPDT